MAIHDDLPFDVWRLVFDELAGDTETLARVGLVSHAWRDLSLPALLNHVDLSSHNNGRIPEEEGDALFCRVVMADYSDRCRPRNLVSRQRAFLRLMIDHPELAIYVKVFTWTLVWMDFNDDDLTDVDLRTWDIFGRMQNVTHLDLASLHEIGWEPYIRQNPARLFPAVTHLRLVGWMHRGLVRAIISSLNTTKLASIQLHYLEDEGALPNGEPMPSDLAAKHARNRADPYRDEGIDDGLWERQERGDAAIFPGPMWFPLRFLGQKRLSSLTHFQISLMPFFHTLDQRNLISMFIDIAKFIRSTKDTLKSLSVELGEEPYLHCKDEEMHSVCGTSRARIRRLWRPLCLHQTLAFLHRLLAALTEEQFLYLTRVDLKGFRILLTPAFQGEYHERTLQYIRDCPFVDEGFMETANLNCRHSFGGHDVMVNRSEDELNELEKILEES
ncbi:hypothetical protein F5Y09DRAFT_309767 [Xylaria sp. FL1042]|nr:hypothetical protein F5Y09DRAFT_309767 [Xylaria sp. FL1042]